ncbi:hypothetical protein L218DRAFT_870323 [Marasmius fiardii PR-910]|nr:hypothetical protein L218DRAFT_870323 [Marasmius fiardii PR-910]
MHERICSVCQLRGRSQVYNTDHSQWIRKDVNYLRHWAKAWRDATTVKERKQIFDDHGVHWSSFWLLEYWDPTRMLVVDAMHTILEGLVHFHCRHVLRLDATALEVSTDGIKVAYDWPWTEYDDDLAPADCKVEEDRIPSVTKIQNALLLAIAGDHCLTLDQLWTRVENAGYRESLCYVVHSLGLPMDKASLDGMSPVIKELYDNRAKQRLENAEGLQGTVFPDSGAKYKHHFIALLLNWRLKQPQRWGTSLTKTGTPETLAHIQHVIQTVVTPAWLHSVPKNYGELKAGSIKADEWRILSSVQLPIALITLWGDDDGCVPPSDDTEAGLLFRALDHTMALFQATIICCRNTTSSSRTAAFRKYLAIWVKDLRSIYPHISQGIPRTNVHAASHLFDFLLAFGPVISWWCFPFERLIGTVQKINTSDHIGGKSGHHL